MRGSLLAGGVTLAVAVLSVSTCAVWFGRWASNSTDLPIGVDRYYCSTLCLDRFAVVGRMEARQSSARPLFSAVTPDMDHLPTAYC